jgi:hypothetical protein
VNQTYDNRGSGLVGQGLEDSSGALGIGILDRPELLRQHDDFRPGSGEFFDFAGISTEQSLGVGTFSCNINISLR